MINLVRFSKLNFLQLYFYIYTSLYDTMEQTSSSKLYKSKHYTVKTRYDVI